MENLHQDVADYYGQELQKSEDLKTNACCTLAPPPVHIREALSLVADEVQAKYYGCGLTIPSAIEGLRILDLGSGSGRDCYIAGKLVGENGHVVGVDMTDEQLKVANDYVEYHREKFGYKKSNVEFIKGNIEKLDELNLEKGSFDLIISNCVINLAADKDKVLKDAFELLKPGGEMFFSDVYADRRVPRALQEDKVLWGECLSGAMYWNDFLNAAKGAGFTDPRVVEDKPITVENADLETLIGDIKFYSVTYRLWKIDGLESDCEDYGQAVAYKGGIPEGDLAFELDDHHYFPKGKIMTVCGNTYNMLHETRFKKYFDFYGTWDTHYGIFEGCGGNIPFTESSSTSAEGSCC
ncbi:methyltransferase type 11 [Putridiphycobacter roseus]|uniref:Arsenite methyltransferase n=1 Tax=Putridiphycobacter roseus TaxID=2219161 RepID=A0A2W1N1H0_9FLAO|nr:methyltransferase domain-containing protein [Putridiphycobacter roseus]PZE18107.1 methyltransferase type 11 [Putridiphycobacter roseus]